MTRPPGHYPLILELDREFPAVELGDDWVDTWVATPPLFHFLMLSAGRVVGFEIHKLRLLNAAISYLAVVLLFEFLHRSLKRSAGRSLLFSFVFLLSPYFFGASFLLLTDNLGILFMLLALILMQAYAERRSAVYFALGCVAIAAACLTRQIYVFLAPIALLLVVLALVPVRRGVHDDGVLWRVSVYVPDVAASSALFWVLAPLGALVVARYAMLHGVRSFGAVYFVAFLAVMLVSELLFQKYFDPIMLLMAFIVSGRRAAWPRLEALGVGILLIAFTAYFFVRPSPFALPGESDRMRESSGWAPVAARPADPSARLPLRMRPTRRAHEVASAVVIM